MLNQCLKFNTNVIEEKLIFHKRVWNDWYEEILQRDTIKNGKNMISMTASTWGEIFIIRWDLCTSQFLFNSLSIVK